MCSIFTSGKKVFIDSSDKLKKSEMKLYKLSTVSLDAEFKSISFEILNCLQFLHCLFLQCKHETLNLEW